MIQIKENPATVGAVNRGIIQNQVHLYTPNQRIAQARLARRYHISRPHAAVIADLLNLGGAENG